MSLEQREVRAIELAARALARLPVRAPAIAVFDAIRRCVPVAAGLVGVLRPGAPDAMVTHSAGLPPDVLESWLSTPPELLGPTIAPILRSRAGALWRDSETVTGALRERLEVMGKLDAAGLGEGGGLKILQRKARWGGSEHFMLALLMERGELVPARAAPVLAALTPAIRDAVLRLRLPLVARESIFAQVVAEQALGYVCLRRGGALLEANRRAHQAAARYRVAAGVSSQRQALVELAARAVARGSGGRTWQIAAGGEPSFLEVSTHRLSRETHALREDILLVMMNEIYLPPSALGELPALARLTARQREIALMVARSGASYKAIADQLSVREATLSKHVENIHRLLGVHSRAELALFLK